MTTFSKLSFLFLGLIITCTLAAQQTAIRQLGPDMQILGLTEGTMIHRSFLYTEDGKRVPYNGLVYVRDSFCLILDTPVDTNTTRYLLDHLQHNMELQVLGVVVSHIHQDALGGLAIFHQRGIPSYAHKKTIAACQARGIIVPQRAFNRKKKLKIGNSEVIAHYPGAAYTPGNLVSYIPESKVLFGGNMVKAYGANKGNLIDADTRSWSKTIQKVQRKFKDATIIVPGQGFSGGQELLEYTSELFQSEDK